MGWVLYPLPRVVRPITASDALYGILEACYDSLTKLGTSPMVDIPNKVVHLQDIGWITEIPFKERLTGLEVLLIRTRVGRRQDSLVMPD